VLTDERVFEEHRAHLVRVGYRITGSVADAEDAVQEAWLRLAGVDESTRTEIRDDRAWLTTVVGRLCLDRLRSAAARRERYVGPWLPEPLLTTGDPDEPLAAVVRDEGVRMAAMVVLERLSPPQRVAFVLHEALSLPYAQIAEVLGCPEATARQHAARARKIVADADPPPSASARRRARRRPPGSACSPSATGGSPPSTRWSTVTRTVSFCPSTPRITPRRLTPHRGAESSQGNLDSQVRPGLTPSSFGLLPTQLAGVLHSGPS
jgi:RNA polymerase sigma factor (sigma-70 family)